MKRIIFIIFIILHSIHVQSQFLPADEIFYRSARQSILCPPEKVYIHTDKNVYVAGETIWMRAHVVDGIAHVPMKLSAYVYVVLQNPFMETVALVRLKADKDGYIHGNIPLPEDLPKGEYSLCAYTQYMKNFDCEYFFKKQIMINSVMNNSIYVETFQRGRNIDIRFTNPITKEIKEIKNFTARISSGEINVSTQDSGYSVKIYNSEEKVILIQAGNYKEFINIDIKPDYDVSFHPEGGNLVAGTFNRVAFKCINSMGQGEDITGTLRDEKDSILIPFKSIHRGMGVISFIPEKGKRYSAICEDINGVQKRFPLPEATDKYTMQVNQIRDKIFVKVLFSPFAENDEKLLVFAHQRGWPVKIASWKKKTPGLTCKLEDFTEGAASFLLVNEDGQIVSERMIFIQKNNPLNGKLNNQNQQSGKREKISIELQVAEKRWNGNCSVSVTDNHDVQPDSCNNILSSLLLSADLRGYIEAPAWYFQKDEQDSLNIRKKALDALMMTQGWRKHDMRNSWNKTYKEPKLLPEQSQRITGKVTTLVTRKPVNKGKVQLMIPTMGVKEEIQTQKDGTFLFDNFDAPDSTIFWVSTYTEKGKDKVTLELDTITYPILKKRLPPSQLTNQQMKKNISQEYLAKVNLKIIQEKDIQHLFLDEVIVTAPKIKFKTEYEKIIGAKSIREETISQSGAIDMPSIIRQHVPSVQITTDEEEHITILLRGKPATLLVDGVIYRLETVDGKNIGTQDILRYLNKNDIEQIDVIHAPYSLIYDPMNASGIIAITTKKGDMKYNAKWPTTNLKTIMPLGFQPTVEFYSPKYEQTVDKEKKEPDLRTTIHWQPTLEIKNGKAKIEFYTADSPVDYSIVIEGVGEDGSLFRMEEKIK